MRLYYIHAVKWTACRDLQLPCMLTGKFIQLTSMTCNIRSQTALIAVMTMLG